MQGSGLEAAAMGKPVLAGDPEAQNDLTKLGIPVPWTVANDEQGIRDGLAKLVRDPTFRQAEAARVHAYVRQYHDYPVVGRKYAEILTEAKRNGPPYRS
jgi:glycosyltransferase involved in cell wall biosynthesis